MNVYDGKLKFKGTFRIYQQRVLDRADSYLKDGKIHIVAAPGSGKTTLGIELIRRLGKPALVISPRLVIRDQWIERIKDAFLLTNDTELLSKDLKKPGTITSITYQTLFSGMTRYKGIEKDDKEDDEENIETEDVDYSEFDLIKTMQDAGVEVLCLDECHHLRSEWWKALEEFAKKMQQSGLKIIALTATPPYDASQTEWERYTNMCGNVDEEIVVPELVKDNCLCPHQDYVMFSFPTAEERREISAYSDRLKMTFEYFLEDEEFRKIVSSHHGLANYEASHDSMLEYPAYLSALLIYLNHCGIHFDKRWKTLLSVNHFPKMKMEWMQILLQGLLYDDVDNYDCTEEYREKLIRELKRKHFIVRKKVVLVENDAIKKMMVGSLGKLSSIITIAKEEYANLGSDLKMLILTDYIRKEYRNAIGFADRNVHSIGVLPVFENLRRKMPESCRLGVLCGSIVILPDTAVEVLSAAAMKKFGKDQLVTTKNIIGERKLPIGYSEVTIKGKNSEIVSLVTEIFEKGCFEIMIGTKSLLGEGYDSPCVNSLILASFVGSFVLSNQMRGRAIRMQQGNPEKTANIWHLVSVEEANEATMMKYIGIDLPPQSVDYYTLKRRMKGFLGVSYDGQTIENGMERLNIIKEPFTTKNIETINEQMLAMAKKRETLRKQWKDAVTVKDEMEVADEVITERKLLKEKVVIFDAVAALCLAILLEIGWLLINVMEMFSYTSLNRGMVFILVAGIFLLLIVTFGYKVFSRISPGRYMKRISQGILDSLKEVGEISSQCKVGMEGDSLEQTVYLKGGTAREKEVFAQCVEEFFAVIDNQRYLLYKTGISGGPYKAYCVPDLFAKRKNYAVLFADNLKKAIGKYELIYTRNPEGRKLLLKARVYAFANISNELAAGTKEKRKKKMKAKLI